MQTLVYRIDDRDQGREIQAVIQLDDSDLGEPLLVKLSAGAVFDADFDHVGDTGTIEVGP